MNTVDMHDVIRLSVDLPAQGLLCGATGTIVEQWASDTFEVEFADGDGQTIAMVALKPDQFEVVWRMPRPASVPE